MNRYQFVISIVAALWVAGCASKEKKEDLGGWAELDSFHTIMAQAFHPMKDSGNLAPAKQVINELAEAASKLASSDLPEKVDNPGMKSELEKLKKDAKSLSDDIKNNLSDELVKEEFSALHQQFHKVMEMWQDSKEENEHDKNERR